MRLALTSPTVRWALDRLGLAPSAISKPDDADDMVNAIVQAELPAQAAGIAQPHRTTDGHRYTQILKA
jgi:hypothetical protein